MEDRNVQQEYQQSDSLSCGTPISEETPKKKSGFKWLITTILIPALVWALADSAGEYLADMTVGQVKNQMTASQTISEIKERAAQLPEYVPGTCTDASYVSEYLNLSFHIDEHWQMCSEEETQEIVGVIVDEYEKSYLQAIINEGLSEEIAKALLENSRTESEFCAWYFDDEGIGQGMAGMYATNLLHFTGDADETDVNSLVADAVAGHENGTTTDVMILGATYTAAVLPISDGLNAAMVYYMADDALCCFVIYYSDGYEEIITSFFAQFSAMN